MTMIFNTNANWGAQSAKALNNHLANFERSSQEVVTGEKVRHPAQDIAGYLKGRESESVNRNIDSIVHKLTSEAIPLTGVCCSQVEALKEVAEKIKGILIQGRDGLSSEEDVKILTAELAKLVDNYEKSVKFSIRGKSMLNGAISAESNLMKTATYGVNGQALSVSPLTAESLADKMDGQLSVPVLSIKGSVAGTGSKYFVGNNLGTSAFSSTSIGLSGVQLDIDDSFKIGNLIFTLKKEPSTASEVAAKFDASGNVDQNATILSLMESLANADFKGNKLYDFSYDSANKSIHIQSKIPGKNISDGIDIGFLRQGVVVSKNAAGIIGMSTTAGGLNNNIDVSGILNNDKFIGKFPTVSAVTTAGSAPSTYDVKISLSTDNGFKYSGTLSGLSSSSLATGKMLVLSSENGQGGSLQLNLSEKDLYDDIANYVGTGNPGTVVIQKNLNNVLGSVQTYQRREIASYQPESGSVLEGSVLSFNTLDVSDDVKVDKINVDRDSLTGNVKVALTLSNGKIFLNNFSKIDNGAVLSFYKYGDSSADEKFQLSIARSIDISTESARIGLKAALADALAVGQAALQYRADVDSDSKVLTIAIPNLTLDALLNKQKLSLSTPDQATLSCEAMNGVIQILDQQIVSLSSSEQDIRAAVESLNNKKEFVNHIYEAETKSNISESTEQMVNSTQGIKQAGLVTNMTFSLKREVTNLVQGAASAA